MIAWICESIEASDALCGSIPLLTVFYFRFPSARERQFHFVPLSYFVRREEIAMGIFSSIISVIEAVSSVLALIYAMKTYYENKKK